MSKENMDWKTLIRDTRYKLGLTRQEFADLLGVTLSTFDSWEFQGKIPTPLTQDLVVSFYNNHKRARELIESQKKMYLSKPEEINRSQIFSEGIAKKMLIIGGLLLLAHILSENKKKNKNGS